MGRYFYDLHIHSCLSPCADNDMTPNNIAGMAALKGLQIVALTDHNSSRNCPAFWQACKKNGIIPVAGMELTTAEDIHLICLFENLEDAMSFNDEIDKRRILIKNRPDIFGEQLITDADDNVTGKEENLLINATSLTLEEAAALVTESNGISFPAHIDRISNGLISTLGDFPQKPLFTCAEFNDSENEATYRSKYAALAGMKTVTDSDAHYLWDISEAQNSIELCDDPYSGALIRKRLFEYLKG